MIKRNLLVLFPHFGPFGGRKNEAEVMDYTVRYDPNNKGIQTITVSYGGFSDTMDAMVYDSRTEYVVSFGFLLKWTEECEAFAAVYNSEGKVELLAVPTVTREGRSKLILSRELEADSIRAFVMDSQTKAPVNKPYTPIWRNK